MVSFNPRLIILMMVIRIPDIINGLSFMIMYLESLTKKVKSNNELTNDITYGIISESEETYLDKEEDYEYYYIYHVLKQ